MTMIDWHFDGLEFATCNCNWGCPCQFNSLPSQGCCQAGAGIHIDQGHFGDVSLDGLSFAGLFAWPGAIHEGHGQALPIVDERASEPQRNAILAIMSGQETEPGATFFNVFASTLETVHPPLFRHIDFHCDLDQRVARLAVDGIVEADGEPIRNRITGAEQRVSVHLPDGFEFTEAEFASGRLKSQNTPPGLILQWDSRHSHMTRLRLTGQGPIRT